MPKVALKHTTLCCVDSRDCRSALIAIRHCLDQCDFAKTLFFTSTEVDLDGIQAVKIEPIQSRRDYSKFIMKNLHRHIESEFVLVVQYDGFILDGSLWTDRFLEFDYIGARWLGSGRYNVGNGGFSLRSKRLLSALQDEDLTGLHPEDVTICVTYRPLLERRYGIKFAPAEIADVFSREQCTPFNTFGFHDRGHPPRRFDRHRSAPLFQETARKILGKYFIYQRLGLDDRPLAFLDDGTVKPGRAHRELYWDLARAGNEVLLTLSSKQEMICELQENPDRVWRGRWLSFEKMPVALYPSV